MHGWKGGGWVRPWLWPAQWPVRFMLCTNGFWVCFLMQCISQSREQPCYSKYPYHGLHGPLPSRGAAVRDWYSRGGIPPWRGAWECSGLAAALREMVTLSQKRVLSFSEQEADGSSDGNSQERPLPMFRWLSRGTDKYWDHFSGGGCQLY